MGYQANRPNFWPLAPNALSVNDLRRFKPLDFTPLAEAHALGFIDDAALRTVLAEGIMRRPSPDLSLFFETSAVFDRKRDIEEELRRLSLLDPPGFRPLWMLLARLILEQYTNPGQAIAMLEELYQWCDHPRELWPFTLYADSQAGATPGDVVHRLELLLRENGV